MLLFLENFFLSNLFLIFFKFLAFDGRFLILLIFRAIECTSVSA